VKNIQGPGRTRAGGVAVPGSQGMPPAMVRACPTAVPATKNAAVVASNERRDGLDKGMRSIIFKLQKKPAEEEALKHPSRRWAS